MSGIGIWLHGFRFKMLILILVPCLFIGSLVGLSVFVTKEISKSAAEVTEIRVPSIKGLQMMDEARSEIRITFLELFSGLTKMSVGEFQNKIGIYLNQYREGWDLYAPLDQTVEEAKEWQKFVPLAKIWESNVNNVISLYTEEKVQEAKDFFEGKLKESFVNSKVPLSRIFKINYDVVDIERINFLNTNKRALWIGFLFGLIGTLITAIFGFIVARNLSYNLSFVADHISTSSSHVHHASSSLSRSAVSLSTAAKQQATSIEETSNSIAVITRMIESNVDVADKSNITASKVQVLSEETSKLMESLSTAMGEILESNKRIEHLVKIIEEIGDKTEVIDDIVFQTQLLSFNASVEAERAGEQGRGFAVVAQEVGSLAQLSGRSASEISSIVKNSIKEAENVARSNKERVEKGNLLALETKVKILEVSKMISSIQEGTHMIASASKD